MKRAGFGPIVTLAVMCLMPLSLARAAAVQTERGFVLVPMPGRVAGAWVEGCPGSVVEGTTQWVAGRSLSHQFHVKSSTWGLHFSVNPGHAATNIDISFRTAWSANWIRYASKKLGGEKGLVPGGAIEAVVCLRNGAPTTFVYRAGTGV